VLHNLRQCQWQGVTQIDMQIANKESKFSIYSDAIHDDDADDDDDVHGTVQQIT